MSDVTLILNAAGRGEPQAAAELLPLVYEELRALAGARLAREAAGQTLQPTALVHEAWLRLVKEEERTWRNREHFFRAAALAMRRILVDRARHKSTLKAGGRGEKLPLEDVELAEATTDDRILLVDQTLDQLEKDDPESARVINLKFFCGLTNKEVAGLLGVSERSIERQWVYAKAALFELMQNEG